jgi:large subunit ribosomal protein L24
MTIKMHVKTGDTVTVITGKDAGKSGKIVRAFPREGKVIIEGVNIKKRHERSRKEGSKGQVVEKPHPIDASNVRK